MIVVHVVVRVDKVWLPGCTRFGDFCPGGRQGGQGFVIFVQAVARVDKVW